METDSGRHVRWKKITTALEVRSAAPGTHDLGDGLRLSVRPTGSRSWLLRYQLNGRRRDIGLGPFPEIGLADARARAFELRQQVKRGIDPLVARKRETPLLFKDAAAQLIEAKQPAWKNPKHRYQWHQSLAAYAFPVLGDLDVAAITTADVVSALRPIWSTKPETASRTRMRIEAVLDYAAALGKRDGPNPAKWQGRLDQLLAKPGKVRMVKHHEALPWGDVPAFVAKLRQSDSTGAKALAFTILTAARSGETRLATHGEIDRTARVWTVPASRTKSGREHRVPLADAAIALLPAEGAPGDLIFASDARPGEPMSDMTLLQLARRTAGGAITVHGFRSCFRDWCGETTTHAREVVEAALAHRIPDKAEASYARGTLFTKRAVLMADWAKFLTSPPAEVVSIDAARRPATR